MTDSGIDQTDIDTFRRRVANRWWRRLTDHEVEDLVGETLQIYWAKSCDGNRIDNPVSWLLAAADRIGNKLRRQLAKVHEREKIEDTGSLANREDRRYQPVRDHGDSALSELLDRISGEQREVVVSCVMHDLPLADVARDLGIKYSTARSHLVRGIGRLRLLAKSAANQAINPDQGS